MRWYKNKSDLAHSFSALALQLQTGGEHKGDWKDKSIILPQ